MKVGVNPLNAGAGADIGLNHRDQADEVIQHVAHRAVFLLLATAVKAAEAGEPGEAVAVGLAIVALNFSPQTIAEAITDAGKAGKTGAEFLLAGGGQAAKHARAKLQVLTSEFNWKSGPTPAPT